MLNCVDVYLQYCYNDDVRQKTMRVDNKKEQERAELHKAIWGVTALLKCPESDLV